MPNEKQDLINHRLTATACKNYTDKEIKKAKDELKTFFSKNTVNTEDHKNELAYQITAPAGAKLLQLQAVGGNSVKYEPTFASDDTTALVKTMPSVVYDFDVNKVKGVSEVSENLIVLNDMVETTDNGLTFSITNGILTMNGTALSNFNFGISLSKTIPVDTYSSLINISGTTTATGNWVLSYSRYEGNLFNLGKTNGNTVTTTTTQEASVLRFYVGSGTVFTNYKIKVMLVKGTTPPTEFKVGYEGIHNNELTGFKVEGSNIAPLNNEEYNITFGSVYSVKVIPFNNAINIENGKTYSFSIEIKGNGTSRFNKVGMVRNLNGNGIGETIRNLYQIISTSYTKYTFTFTATNDEICYGLFLETVDADATFTFKEFILNYGSVALDYVPYISPTTLPIDLTSIVDSSGNKLFEDGSLKGIGSVYDEVTPYKAIKRFGAYTFTGNETFITITTNTEGWTQFAYTPSPTATNSSDSVVLTDFCRNVTYAEYQSVSSSLTEPLVYHYGTGYRFILQATTVEQARAILSGKTFLYELATPQEADIDLPQLKGIEGHSNGSITALNTYDMAVPSEIRYNSIIQETLATSITINRNGVDILTRNLPTITSDGYGVNANAHNLRVFSDYEGNETKERHIIVEKVVLGSLNWQSSSDFANCFYATIDDKLASSLVLLNDKYTNLETRMYASTLQNDTSKDKCIVCDYSTTSKIVIIKDTVYDNAATFKTAMSGIYLYYELATEDISQLDYFDYFFDVEEGDVITFNNPYAQQVYATYSFIIKEAKSNE